MRKLASIRRISEICPIKDADAIECAIVDGWKVVIKKNDYKVGDLVVYCEIDSWIPNEFAPFLSKGKEPREFNGVKGERLRTVKLRGQLSQGLLLPLDVLAVKTDSGNYLGDWEQPEFEGYDVSERLGIQKWEAPVPAQLAGLVKGNFPTQIPKTDQERAQNLVREIAEAQQSGMLFEVTEKLEGSSMTVYRIGGEFGVCSRNLDLKFDENNAFWRVAVEEMLNHKMEKFDPFWDFAIQGELIGPGVQGNIYGLNKLEFHVYDVYNIQKGEYLTPVDRIGLIERMGLKHVPVVAWEKDLGSGSVEEIISWADDHSKLNSKQLREGIVFKPMNGGDFTFKCVSNEYLMGEKY